MQTLLGDTAAFPQQDHLHSLVVYGILTSKELLQLLASLAILFKPQLFLYLHAGHGREPEPGRPAMLAFETAQDAGAVQLAPLLRAVRAKTTVVLLECCFSASVFSNIHFPGLVVVPACGEDQKVTSGFTTSVLVPIMRGACAPSDVCQRFKKECLANGGLVGLWRLLEHIRWHLPVS